MQGAGALRDALGARSKRRSPDGLPQRHRRAIVGFRFRHADSSWRAICLNLRLARPGHAMADHLQQTLYVTGRYAVANVRLALGLARLARRRAVAMLQLLFDRHASAELQDGAVRALVAQQCRCGWPTARRHRLSNERARRVRGERTSRPGIGGRLRSAARPLRARSSVRPLPRKHSRCRVARCPATRRLLRATAAPCTTRCFTPTTFRPTRRANSPRSASYVPSTEPGPPSSPLATMDLPAVTPVTLGASKVYDIGVRVIVDHPVDRLVIEDPLPAGFEAVDASFRTTSTAVTAQADSWAIDSQTIYRDKVVSFAAAPRPRHLRHALPRALGNPRHVPLAGSPAYLQDAPEQLGEAPPRR